MLGVRHPRINEPLIATARDFNLNELRCNRVFLNAEVLHERSVDRPVRRQSNTYCTPHHVWPQRDIGRRRVGAHTCHRAIGHDGMRRKSSMNETVADVAMVLERGLELAAKTNPHAMTLSDPQDTTPERHPLEAVTLPPHPILNVTYELSSLGIPDLIRPYLGGHKIGKRE